MWSFHRNTLYDYLVNNWGFNNPTCFHKWLKYFIIHCDIYDGKKISLYSDKCCFKYKIRTLPFYIFLVNIKWYFNGTKSLPHENMSKRVCTFNTLKKLDQLLKSRLYNFILRATYEAILPVMLGVKRSNRWPVLYGVKRIVYIYILRKK